jgi:hypothetical protein
MPHRFEAVQEPGARLGALQATAVAQPIAGGHVTALDGLGRGTMRAV